MDKLFLIGVILAGCGIALVLGQLIWTVVLNCRILEDLVLHKKPRYDYVLNPWKIITDMTVFCRFIRGDEHPLMREIIYRELLKRELTLRVIGELLEIFGVCLMAADVLNLTFNTSVIYLAAIVFAAWIAVYTVNFVLAFVVSSIAYFPYNKRLLK